VSKEACGGRCVAATHHAQEQEPWGWNLTLWEVTSMFERRSTLKRSYQNKKEQTEL